MCWQGTFFEYATRRFHIAVGGKLLANWPKPQADVFVPCVNAFVSDTNRDVYEAFATRLFSNCGIQDLHDPGKLKTFRDTMVASLLMNLEAHSKAVSVNDPVIQKLKSTANLLDMQYEELLGWGEEIKTRFEAENVGQMLTNAVDGALAESVKELANSVLRLQTEQKEMQQKMETSQLQMKEQVRQNEEAAVKRHEELLAAFG